MLILGGFTAGLTFEGEGCVFTPPILVDEIRDDADPPESADVALTFSSELWDAVTSRVRWTGASVTFDSETIVVGRARGFSFEESMTPAQAATLKFKVVGDLWSIPSQDFVPPEPSTCPVFVPTSARHSPRMLGNKLTRLSLLLGKSPMSMKTWRLFKGQSLQKNNKGTVPLTGEINCVDDGILYADKAICFEVLPFSGMRRDEVVRAIAAQLGFTAASSGVGISSSSGPKVFCPIGKVITKPILLTNASLLPFLNEFGAAENWFFSFDENGNLFGRRIELKVEPDLPDWTLDSSLGDFDYETLEEVPPSKPPTKIIVNLTQPVRGRGPGGSSLTVTTVKIEEDSEFHNPECVKVRPSGNASHLLGDGSYHTLAAEELMLVTRKVTEVTTVDGLEVKRVVRDFAFYNPRAYDPNYDTYPPGTSYDGAYGNKSFHRDEAESFMEISEDVTLTTRDVYGTNLGTVQTSKTWHAPHRGAVFSGGTRTRLLNDAGATPPAYVYAGGTTRVQAAEDYGLVLKVEKDYSYGSDGSLADVSERRYEFYSPDSRCDVVHTNTIPDSGPPTDDGGPSDPPIENPPPSEPPGAPPNWHPQLVGPVSQNGGVFVFRVSMAGAPVAPAGHPITSTVLIGGRLLAPGQGNPPVYGTGGGGSIGTTGVPDGFTMIPGTAEEGFASIRFSGTKPVGTVYVSYSMNWSGADSAHRYSNTVIFDPWASVPAGGSL